MAARVPEDDAGFLMPEVVDVAVDLLKRHSGIVLWVGFIR